jgi:hypothetical protein
MNMNLNPGRGKAIAIAAQAKQPAWQTIVIFTLAFWISSSLILDLLIMPGLYASGMMAESGFATAGYLIFWMFNRVEVLAAAVVLTGVLACRNTERTPDNHSFTGIILSLLLLSIALVCTYVLTPEMSALGLQLNLFEPVVEVPNTMNQLHGSYWVLEAIKLVAGGVLLNSCYRSQVASNQAA